MTTRRDVRRPHRRIEVRSSWDHDIDWTERILNFFDGVSATLVGLFLLGAFLIGSVVVCWSLLGLPHTVMALGTVLMQIVIACWPTSVAFWAMFPFAVALTAFAFWLMAAYEARENGSHDIERGRRILTAEEARRKARHQFPSGDRPPSRFHRR